jgi:hypothetical protein
VIVRDSVLHCRTTIAGINAKPVERKSEVLGTLKEYKTRRLAERALEQRLSDVNSLTYKPRPTATFSAVGILHSGHC